MCVETIVLLVSVFSLPSPIGRRIACFQFVAISSKAAVMTLLCESLFGSIFTSLGEESWSHRVVVEPHKINKNKICQFSVEVVSIDTWVAMCGRSSCSISWPHPGVDRCFNCRLSGKDVRVSHFLVHLHFFLNSNDAEFLHVFIATSIAPFQKCLFKSSDCFWLRCLSYFSLIHSTSW